MSFRLSITDKDMGLKAALARVAQMARGAVVKVGIQGKSVPRANSGPDNVQVGIWQEFGTADGRVPERSFLRATADENAARYLSIKEKLAGDILDGKQTVDSALGLLGLKVVADVKARIVAGIPPPNAPSTIAAKGSSTPLIDTGQLLRSIDFQVKHEKPGAKEG